MFNVVLIEPQIPQNTGNIARLCAATDMQLVIVGRPGFKLNDRYLKRAGLDYWEYVRITHIPDVQAYYEQLDMTHTYLLTTKTNRPYTQIQPRPGDNFLFGPETAGLPEWLLKANPQACFTIPMKNPNVRSLNLATSVGIVMYNMLARFNFGLDVETPSFS
ncbi:MAG: tRNA (cytidine(34)-2'-O)-methyltransferase [Anaerolineae bacterium]|nr:tRNA (cytidine(34)-2'-O)-methyltransferase [Anaerolineae bacterium]